MEVRRLSVSPPAPQQVAEIVTAHTLVAHVVPGQDTGPLVAGVVPAAKESGARVVILNAEPTEMDMLADVVLRGSISEILPRLVGQ